MCIVLVFKASITSNLIFSYLESILSCYHQCFHKMLTEEKRRQKHYMKRIEDLEYTDSCLHGCMHLHPYLS